MNVFRDSLHRIVRFLMALPLCAAAAPASAVDVDEVRFDVIISHSSEAADEIVARICVLGSDLTNGSVTFPTSATPLSLQVDPDGSSCDHDQQVLVRGLSFANEAELAAVMPAGSYVLRVANSTAQGTITYQRPAVPSPAISAPTAGAVLPPGPVEVEFTACSICNQVGDLVEAQLVDATPTELAFEELDESSESWIPQDGMTALLLPENGEFRARIQHSAVRQANVAISNDDDSSFLFTNAFVQFDEVGFRTGFEPPEGDFCVVVNGPVNGPTPSSDCSPLDDDLLFLLDTSGMVATSVAGRAVDYTFTVDSKGTLTGTALADLGGDATKETPGAIKGKLKGKGGELQQKLSFPLVNETFAAKLKVSVADVLSIPLDSRERTQKASGSLGGTKVKEEDVDTDTLPFTPLGWRVDFSVAVDGAVSSGLLTLDGGRTFPLEGANKFNLATNLSSLKLQSADKGIKLQLKKVELDDEVTPTELVGGALSYKILGQSGKADLPAPAP